jgi:hypothetical protein
VTNDVSGRSGTSGWGAWKWRGGCHVPDVWGVRDRGHVGKVTR